MSFVPHVSLVGAGPGDPELLTIKAVRAIRRATVLLVDDLVGDGVLRYARRSARIVYVGKRGGCASTPQAFIDKLMAAEALKGERVVRLKGGDPFVFGRGGEELTACVAAGIPVDVVPGITSAVAVPEAAGIPVTHRGVASAVHIVNGQSEMTPATLAALGDDGVTTVILMGVGALPRLVSDALRAGVPADRPVAIVERGHHTDQRTTRTSLGAVVLEAGRIGVRNPAVIVVGEVARTGMLVPDLLAAGSRSGGTSL